MLILSINQGWATRQVDFSKYFVQDTLLEYVYLALPYYYYYDTGEDRDMMFMKLNKSLNGLVQKSLYRYNNLKVYFEPRGFKPFPLYPFILYGRGMISLIYVDDVFSSLVLTKIILMKLSRILRILVSL